MTLENHEIDDFEKRVRIGVALNEVCPCCQGIGELSTTLPVDQEGYRAYCCDQCGCMFAQVSESGLCQIADGLNCSGVVAMLKERWTRKSVAGSAKIPLFSALRSPYSPFLGSGRPWRPRRNWRKPDNDYLRS